MIKPNITQQEFLAYIDGAAASITNTMNDWVAKGRMKQKEAADYLAIHLPKVEALKNKFHSTTLATYPVLCLGIRGYYMNTKGKPGVNDRGIYDDGGVLTGLGYFNTFLINTDPRKQGFGIGSLLPGVHEFKQGIHNYKRPVAAFRTANAAQILPVLRDGQNGIKDGLTVNMHPGGENEVNSIACQTVIKSQWATFKKDAYRLTDQTNKILTYLLVEQFFYPKN